jgi:hypothetical protein
VSFLTPGAVNVGVSDELLLKVIPDGGVQLKVNGSPSPSVDNEPVR